MAEKKVVRKVVRLVDLTAGHWVVQKVDRWAALSAGLKESKSVDPKVETMAV